MNLFELQIFYSGFILKIKIDVIIIIFRSMFIFAKFNHLSVIF